MNKKITILLLVVVLAAMSLVLYSQMQQTDSGTLVSGSKSGIDRDGRVIPKDKNNGALPVIEPPLGANGAPRTVTLTSGQEPSQPKTNATTEDIASAESATTSSAPGASEKTGDAPGLVPWEVPGKKEAEKKAVPAPGTQQKAAEKTTPKNKGAEKPQTEQNKAEAAPKKEGKPAQAKPQASKPTEPGVRQLTRIKLTPKGQSMHLRIEADGGFSCKTFVLTGPDRLVIDLPGKWKGMQTPSVPSNQLVKKARVGEQPEGPRIVLDLSRPIKGHQVQRQGNTIEVILQ